LAKDRPGEAGAVDRCVVDPRERGDAGAAGGDGIGVRIAGRDGVVVAPGGVADCGAGGNGERAGVGGDGGGAVPTVVEDGRTGVLVPAENAELLATGIADLLRDPANGDDWEMRRGD